MGPGSHLLSIVIGERLLAATLVKYHVPLLGQDADQVRIWPLSSLPEDVLADPRRRVEHQPRQYLRHPNFVFGAEPAVHGSVLV